MDKKIIQQFRKRFSLDEDDLDKSLEVLMGYTVREIEQFLLESMERAYELGFHTGFEDCAKMVERGEHLYCCITPGKAKETDSKHLTQSGEKE